MRSVVVAVGSSAFILGSSGCGGSAEGVASTISSSALSAPAQASARCRQPLPSTALEFPSGNELDFSFAAEGVQIYHCTAGSPAPSWVFFAPQATLYDRKGRVAGRHYAGPTWEANDGSTVKGARVAGVTPDPSAVPWLLLSAAAHTGDGKMSEVSFIQRVATVGGVAPDGGCDVSTVGAEAQVPYTASYCFAEADE